MLTDSKLNFRSARHEPISKVCFSYTSYPMVKVFTNKNKYIRGCTRCKSTIHKQGLEVVSTQQLRNSPLPVFRNEMKFIFY